MLELIPQSSILLSSFDYFSSFMTFLHSKQSPIGTSNINKEEIENIDLCIYYSIPSILLTSGYCEFPHPLYLVWFDAKTMYNVLEIRTYKYHQPCILIWIKNVKNIINSFKGRLNLNFDKWPEKN